MYSFLLSELNEETESLKFEQVTDITYYNITPSVTLFQQCQEFRLKAYHKNYLESVKGANNSSQEIHLIMKIFFRMHTHFLITQLP